MGLLLPLSDRRRVATNGLLQLRLLVDSLLQAVERRVSVGLSSDDVVALILLLDEERSGAVDVVEYDIGAGLGGVAQQHSGQGQTAMRRDVAQRHAVDGHARLSGTGGVERVEEGAARVRSVSRLLLLLWADPYSMPERRVDAMF